MQGQSRKLSCHTIMSPFHVQYLRKMHRDRADVCIYAYGVCTVLLERLRELQKYKRNAQSILISYFLNNAELIFER